MFSKEFNSTETKKILSDINVDKWLLCSIIWGIIILCIEPSLLLLYIVQSIFQIGAWCSLICISSCYLMFVSYSLVHFLLGLICILFCPSYCQFFLLITILQWLCTITLSYKIPFNNPNAIPLKHRFLLFTCSVVQFLVIWFFLLF